MKKIMIIDGGPRRNMNTAAMVEALSATGCVDAATVGLSAARIASGEARCEYDEGVDLGAYDRAFRLVEGGDGDAA